MKALVVKYFLLIKIYIIEYKTHLLRIFFKLTQLPIQMIMYLFLWIFIKRESPVDMNYMILYYLLTGMLSLAYPFLKISVLIQQDVMEGSLSNVLVRPYPYMMPYFCRYVGWMIIYSVIYIPILLFLLLTGTVLFNNEIFFIFQVIIGMLIEFMIWYIIGIVSLYIEKIRGIIRLLAAIKLIVSGALIPLRFMPEWLQKITSYFPFKYYIYLPVNNLLSSVSYSENITALLKAFLWLVALYVLSLTIWSKGKKHMQVNIS